MKREVNPFDYAGQICKALPGGILLTTRRGEEVNTMTIGWGTMGVDWSLPIFIAYVRESRYTKQLLEENGEFTINVPLGDCDKKILSYCGTKSGRDTDKIADLGLHLEEGETISVPGIKELPLTLECKVIYTQDQDPNAILPEIQARSYPPFFPDGRGDYHTAFYGQILNAYVIE